MPLTEATIAELSHLMSDGAVTSAELVESYRHTIKIEDADFNAIAFLNPDADEIAKGLDKERANGIVRGSLHGIPILLKDNINTADKMMTSAGSLALDGSIAVSDSQVVKRLRDAGAVILGKTNLSEWANFRSTCSSSGWSSRGGQVRNAYALDRTPGGSSSGSAVAVARDFCVAAIGTETDGSIVSPSAMNGVVGIKPTVGLVGRSGIIPISSTQDTAGPIGRTVADAATLLSAIVGADLADPATIPANNHQNMIYEGYLDPDCLRHSRIGVIRNYAGFHAQVDAVFENAIWALRDAGASVLDGLTLTPRTEIRPHELIVMLTEFKVGINVYLGGLSPGMPIKSLSDLIRFNETNAEQVMPYFGQELLIKAEETKGLNDSIYKNALTLCKKLTRQNGIDRLLQEKGLDALIAPTTSVPWVIDWINGDHVIGGSSCQAAVSGYPSITVPMGNIHGLPVGLLFFAGNFSEHKLIGLSHAFEQVIKARKKPGVYAEVLA